MGRKSKIQLQREANLRGWRGFKSADMVNFSDGIEDCNPESGRDALPLPMNDDKDVLINSTGMQDSGSNFTAQPNQDQVVLNEGSKSAVMAAEVQGLMATPGLTTVTGKHQTINSITGFLIESDEDVETDKEADGLGMVDNKGNSALMADDLDNMLQLDHDDVVDETNFWKQAVMCRILGANPPWSIIEGFVRRIWAKFDIDKISFLHKGVFLVRFKSMAMQEQVLLSGYYLFDNKPLIVKPWSKDLDLKLDALQAVPLWIKLHNVPLKCWGKGLPKIASLVGKFVKRDAETERKNQLGYARVLVEVKLDQKFPDQIAFKDEEGSVVRVQVEFEWKPITCLKCKGLGHETHLCRKGDKPRNQGPVKGVHKVQPMKKYARKAGAFLGMQSFKDVLNPKSKGGLTEVGAKQSYGMDGTGVLDVTQFPSLGRVKSEPDKAVRFCSEIRADGAPLGGQEMRVK